MNLSPGKDLKDCVVLSVGTNAPPRFHGGLDQSMWSVARRIAPLSKETYLLGVANDEAEAYDDVIDGVRVLRRRFTRPYPPQEHGKPPLTKAAFQLADHLAPSNVTRFRQVLDQVNPDIVLVHSLVGIGFNVVSELAARDLRVVFYLHELGLACINRAMFRQGSTCKGWCLPCRASSTYQARQHANLNRVAYISPSQANLDKVAERFDFRGRPTHAILNANAYPTPSAPRTPNDGPPRLIFVGRIDREKGVPFVLEVLADLAVDHRFTVRIVGDGSELEMLRRRYADADWCEFLGWRTQAEIADLFVDSDLMLAPSLWSENSPGVVVHALACGTPVMGSAAGGIPELVEPGVNGLLAAPGDGAAWRSTLTEWLSDAGLRQRLLDTAALQMARLAAPEIFARHLAVIDGTRHAA